MASGYLDAYDADCPYGIAGEIARWFSKAPNAPDRMMSKRMENFYSDPLVSTDYGEPPSNAASIMQVSFFETLWWLPNAEITIPQVTTPEYLAAEKDYLCQWVGADTYEEVMSRIKFA